jgi:hypothetical protein
MNNPAASGRRIKPDLFVGRAPHCNFKISPQGDGECTPSRFKHNNDGSQQNICRDLIINYIKRQTVENGRLIAERLQSVTTKRSGLGLLFLTTGYDGENYKFLISRFRADNGILAEEDEKSLNVEFIEKVFMKKVTAYKFVLYFGNSLDSDESDRNFV